MHKVLFGYTLLNYSNLQTATGSVILYTHKYQISFMLSEIYYLILTSENFQMAFQIKQNDFYFLWADYF